MESIRLDAGCRLGFTVETPTSFVFILCPQSGAAQRIESSTFVTTPPTVSTSYFDSFGNRCLRIDALPGPFSVEARVLAQVSPTIDIAPGAPSTQISSLPNDVLQYLLPSRYCPSDRLLTAAREIAGDALMGYDQIEAVRAWIATNIAYRYGASDATTDAAQTMAAREGVCRDFAHLGIALCRALDVPARMVAGYLHELKPMDLHAWFEAFVGGRWYTFDATQNEPRGGRIVLAFGRDAADVAFATQFGDAIFDTMEVFVNEQ